MCVRVCVSVCRSVWGRENLTLSQGGLQPRSLTSRRARAEGPPLAGRLGKQGLRLPQRSRFLHARQLCACHSRLTLISADSYQPHIESWKLA